MSDARQNLECGDLSPPSPVGDLSPTNGPDTPTPELPRQVAEEKSGDESPHSKAWPHAPVHKMSDNGLYIVTAGTLDKRHFFNTNEKLSLLESKLLELANRYQWQIEAWAVFPNHYHYVARGCPSSQPLRKYITHLHADTARTVNKLDQIEGRKVWFNFWDTKLTFETSYLARLNYVHQNAVKHGVVLVANQYRWCSAAWFERVVTPAMVQTIYSFKTEEVQVQDDF
jgi:putative transposase